MEDAMKAIVIILFCVATVGYSYDDCFYPTDFDQGWMRKCPDGKFVSHLVSSFQPKFNDRMWMVCCRTLPRGTTRCNKWTEFENKFSSALNFVCPHNEFITGMASRHSGHLEDRRYKFRCCPSPEIRLTNCKKTKTLNEFGGILNYNVTSGRVITGIRGIYSTSDRDRQFRFITCEFKK